MSMRRKMRLRRDEQMGSYTPSVRIWNGIKFVRIKDPYTTPQKQAIQRASSVIRRRRDREYINEQVTQ